MPLCQPVHQHGIYITVRFEENRLVWVHIGAIVFALPQHVAIDGAIAVLNVVTIRVESGHHHISLVTGVLDYGGCADLGVYCRIPGMEAVVDALLRRWR